MPEAGAPAGAAYADRWLEAAERFYDREAAGKALPGRHRLFAAGYRRILPMLGLVPGSLLLDAGCGCGELAAAAEGTGIRVTGADVSRTSLRQARGFHPGSPFLAADLARLPFAAARFDAVAAITSVEFCRDRAAVFREFHRVLRKGGRLYLDVRNDAFLPFRLLRPALPLLAKAGILEPYPADGFRDLSLDEWAAEGERGGFRLLSAQPSAWPWNFGGPATRAKNMLIEMVKIACPVRHHYMVGLLLEKAG
jgi:SAM-dependent methyltransferase